MDGEAITTEDLLAAWREASQAAELAERLAQQALDVATQADGSQVVSGAIADLAEGAATAAEEAARAARRAAALSRKAGHRRNG